MYKSAIRKAHADSDVRDRIAGCACVAIAESSLAGSHSLLDQPREALQQADALVQNVMRDRGYPMSDFEQRAADISPDHPQVVDNYRIAHGIASRTETGEVSTEDLRQAMVHYRTLFNDLLGTNERTNPQ